VASTTSVGAKALTSMIVANAVPASDARSARLARLHTRSPAMNASRSAGRRPGYRLAMTKYRALSMAEMGSKLT